MALKAYRHVLGKLYSSTNWDGILYEILMLICEPTEAEEESLQVSVLSTTSLAWGTNPASFRLQKQASLPPPSSIVSGNTVDINEYLETQVAFFIYSTNMGGRHLYLTLPEAHFHISSKKPVKNKV